jgi:hypothetical protein
MSGGRSGREGWRSGSVTTSTVTVSTAWERVDVGSDVAATFGPFVVFGQNGADEADDPGPVWEDPHDVGAASDRAVHSGSNSIPCGGD